MAASSSNVKSLIRRFELLASYSSVPNVRGEFLVNPTYQVQRQQQQQQGGLHTPLGDIQELERVEAQNTNNSGMKSSSSEVELMPTSGYFSLWPQGYRTVLQPPAGSAVKPRSSYNTLTRAETLFLGDFNGSLNGPAESTARVGDGSANKADCGSTTHCTSAPRLALRRLGQSVKRKASFFIEQSQKQDYLPIRKGPPPKQLFGGSGENMGKKVRRKVTEKVGTVRKASGDQTKGLVVVSRSVSNREGEKRSSEDGADDNIPTGTETGAVVLPLGRERSSTESERESVGTGLSSNWSSTSYPLTAPMAPPVMRGIPSKFIHSLFRRSLKPPTATNGSADSCEYDADNGISQRLREIKQVPVILQRGNSSTATLQAVGGSKPGSIAEQESLRGKKSRKLWRNWSEASRKGMDGVGEMAGRDTIRKRRITPSKVSVRSLIARFRQAESVGQMCEGDRGVYRTLNMEPDRSRTSLKTQSVVGEQRRARNAFVDIECAGHSSGHAWHGQKQPKPYLHSGSGRRPIKLRIALKNEEFWETDEEEEPERQDIGNYDEREGSERGSIGAMSRSHSDTGGDVRSIRESDDESSGTEFIPRSLNSTDTIVTTKNSSGSQKQSSIVYTSNDERDGSTSRDLTVVNVQRWSRNSGEINHGYISDSASGGWYKISKQLGLVVAGSVNTAGMGMAIRQNSQQLIRPIYRYQAYQPPKPLQPIVVYDVDVRGQIGSSYIGRAGRSQHVEAYRGTPAPGGFISRRRTGDKQGLSEEEGSGGSESGSGSGSGMSGEGMPQGGGVGEESPSSLATDELGYIYVDDSEDKGEGPDEVLSDSDSERSHYTGVRSADEYGEPEGEINDYEEYTVAEEAVQTSTTRETTLSAKGTSLFRDGILSELELTPPLVLNGYGNTNYHHHKRHLESTSQQASSIVTRPPRPAYENPGPYSTSQATSTARRLMRQHEAAMRVVGTILFDGVDMLNELGNIEVVGFGDGSSGRREGLDKEREWEELMEEQENEVVVRVKLPVRGIPISGGVVQPKAKNYVVRVAIEKFVLACG